MSFSSDAEDPSNIEAEAIEIRTGSRLHFGLFSFGRRGGRQYGGVGLMVESPPVRLRLERTARFQVAGPLAGRLAGFAEHWMHYHGLTRPPPCRLKLLAAPEGHVGFGSGTQLGCAVAAGLSRLFARSIGTAEELALASGRAARSAIGTHGFLRGGLILDDGKLEGQAVGELLARQAFPAAWRVLLLWPRQMALEKKYSGNKEQEAFRQMPAVAAEREAALRAIALGEIGPAAAQTDFSRFSRAVTRYNRLAGECYHSFQGGTYANATVARLVERLKDLGVEGAGQSSWGPLLFAFVPSAQSAEDLQQQLKTTIESEGLCCHISSALNTGARVGPV